MRRRSGVVSHSVGGAECICLPDGRLVCSRAGRRSTRSSSWVRLRGLRDSWDAVCCALERLREGSGCWVAPWVASWAETGGKGFFQRIAERMACCLSKRRFSFSITLAASSVIISELPSSRVVALPSSGLLQILQQWLLGTPRRLLTARIRFFP
jgi:hypothetical protein